MVYELVKTAPCPSRADDSENCETASSITALLTKHGFPVQGITDPGGHNLTWPLLRIIFACSLFSFFITTVIALGLWWGYLASTAPEWQDEEALVGASPAAAGSCFAELLRETAAFGHEEDPYQFTTGVQAHKLPAMYGRIREKTIWAFWHDPVSCPFSTRCSMPAYIQLCMETITKNSGSFDLKILYADTVDQYVSVTELPVVWSTLGAAQRRDALMNALLARYGGVALDLSAVLLGPLDDKWEEMVESGVTFRGYMYRLNGKPWPLPEASCSWFLMSRREGIFSSAVSLQRVGVCGPGALRAGLALGDRTLTPVLSMFNYTLPKCFDDEAVADPAACPELGQPDWPGGLSGPARNDRKLMLQDPRDGPQVPFARVDEFGVAMWHVANSTKFDKNMQQFLQVPPDMLEVELAECDSMKDCWERVFLPRLNHSATVFVKIFNVGDRLQQMSFRSLLSDQGTYFYNWLKLAGLNMSQLMPPG